MSDLSIGIIGGGGITSSVHLPLLSCIDNVNIEFIADTVDPAELATSYDTKSIKISNISDLPDCDIALLAIPVGVKNDYIEEFAKRDCYIFTEKPFAIDIKTHELFLKMSKKITCNYMRKFYNSTRQLKDIISSDIFGPIEKMSVVEGGIIGKTGRGKDSYQSNPKLSGGGFLTESSCHTFSQLDFLFSEISLDSSETIWSEEFDIETNATLRVNNQNTFSIDYTGTMIRHVEPKTTIFFKQNKIEFNHLEPESIFTISSLTNSDFNMNLEKETFFASTYAQAYYLKWKDFLKAISSSSNLDVNSETSFTTTKLISEIKEVGAKK